MAASYPTAIKTFTTKTSGDTIQPAHINDLQDEVAAIEAGLLGGAASLQSSNSTLANLNVPGGSTLASLHVSGNSTISGILTVQTIVSTSIVAGVVTSYVRAYANAPSEFSTAATVVAYNTEEADLLGEYDSTSYTFTPQASGYYLIHAQGYAANIAAALEFACYVNGTRVLANRQAAGAGNNTHVLGLSGTLNLSSGAAGSIQFKTYYPDGSTNRLSSGAAYTRFDITKLF